MNYLVDLLDTETGHPVDYTVNNLPYIIQRKDLESDEYQRASAYMIVVLCFATPFEVLTRDGLLTGAPGDCIVVAPTFPEYHGTVPGEPIGFVNDWMHVRVADVSAFETMDFPMNALIKTGDPLFLRGDLIRIRDELLYRRELYEEMTSSIVEQMLIRLKRAYIKGENPHSGSVYDSRLLELRQSVSDSLDHNWTVARMAGIMGLSASRFTVLYRAQFNASPMEDLILMRLTAAKRLLISTDLSGKAIAARCGFSSEYYFSRLFKNKVGVSPSTYRRK